MDYFSDNVNWDLLGTLNSTIVNVALPVMPQEMKVSINAIQWSSRPIRL